MRGRIHYEFKGEEYFPCAAILESEAYPKGVKARGKTYNEARSNLIHNLLSSDSPTYIPPDEIIEF